MKCKSCEEFIKQLKEANENTDKAINVAKSFKNMLETTQTQTKGIIKEREELIEKNNRLIIKCAMYMSKLQKLGVLEP